eukprot:3636830-Alexandrium_andersonii.AAC.1
MHPWGPVFQIAAGAAEVETMAFWSRNVVNKALLFVTRAKQPADLVSEGAVLELNRKGVATEQVAAETGLATP